METHDISNTLEKFGLTKNEAIIYLASIELGSAKVNEISKKAKIIRESTYGILKSLIEKGLISYVIKSGIKYFEAAEPKKLKSILKEKEQLIDNILPELEILKKSQVPKPNIKIFEGKEGIKTIMEELLTSKEEILSIASNKNLKQLFEFYFPNFVTTSSASFSAF